MPRYVLQFEWNEPGAGGNVTVHGSPGMSISHTVIQGGDGGRARSLRHEIESVTKTELDQTLCKPTSTDFDYGMGIGFDSVADLCMMYGLVRHLKADFPIMITVVDWDQPTESKRICPKHQKEIHGRVCEDCLIEGLRQSPTQVQAIPNQFQVTGPDWPMAYMALACHVTEAYAHASHDNEDLSSPPPKWFEALSFCLADIRSVTTPMYVMETGRNEAEATGLGTGISKAELSEFEHRQRTGLRHCTKCGHSYVWVHLPGSSEACCPNCGHDQTHAIVKEALKPVCEHDRSFSDEILTSSPPQRRWICRKCGEEGVMIDPAYTKRDYSDIRRKFAKNPTPAHEDCPESGRPMIRLTKQEAFAFADSHGASWGVLNYVTAAYDNGYTIRQSACCSGPYLFWYSPFDVQMFQFWDCNTNEFTLSQPKGTDDTRRTEATHQKRQDPTQGHRPCVHGQPDQA